MTDDVSEMEQNPDAYLSRWTIGMLNLAIQAAQQRGEGGGFFQIYQRGLDSKAEGAHELTFERLGANQGRMAIAERFDSGLDGIAGFARLEPGPPPTIYFESFWSGRRGPDGAAGAFGGTGIAMSLALKRTITGKLRPVDGNAKLEIPGPQLPVKQRDTTEPAADTSYVGALGRAPLDVGAEDLALDMDFPCKHCNHNFVTTEKLALHMKNFHP
jgi:hypothetical protein